MSPILQPLTSAEAVEVAAFCWPDVEWQKNGEAAAMNRRIEWFSLLDWGCLHRAAAVLVERGFGPALDESLYFAIGGTCGMASGMIHARLFTLPEESLARAILATVREVRG